MGSIRDLYADAMIFENPFMAYGIFLMAARDLIDWDADENTLTFDPLSFDEINAAIKLDALNLKKVNLYSMKIKNNLFAFILSNNEKSAIAEFIRVNRKEPLFTAEVNGYMGRSMYYEETKKTLSFREVRDQVKEFPHYVCDYEKENRSYEEVERDYFEMRKKLGFNEIPFSKR